MKKENPNYYVTIEKQNNFEIIENKYGEIAIFIDARDGQPEHPELLFDGKKTAILKRSIDFSIKLENIHKDAKEPLSKVKVVTIAELNGQTVERVYGVPVEKVEKILTPKIEPRKNNTKKPKMVDKVIEQFGAVKCWKNGENA